MSQYVDQLETDYFRFLAYVGNKSSLPINRHMVIQRRSRSTTHVDCAVTSAGLVKKIVIYLYNWGGGGGKAMVP